MDELVKYLTSKIGYTLTFILGFGLPGNVLIFIWNEELYLELDILKLILLSFGITFMLFIPNLILIAEICIIAENILKRKIILSEPYMILFVPISLTVIEIGIAIACKIVNSDFTMNQCWKNIIGPIVVIVILVIMAETIISAFIALFQKNRRKK